MPWRSVLLGILTAAMLVVGCSKKGAPGASAPPMDASAMPGADAAPQAEEDGGWPGDPLEALAEAQAELEGYEDALLASGVELPGDVTTLRADAGKSSVAAQTEAEAPVTDRCERRCELATHICDLRGRICALADEHGGDARYARVCERATLDCDHATEVCEGCEG